MASRAGERTDMDVRAGATRDGWLLARISNEVMQEGYSVRELPSPPLAQQDGTFEVLRVWTGEAQPQQCVLQTAWSDPMAWGLLLVDVARHAARAYAGSTFSEEEALKRIKSGFDAEWNSPTDLGTQVKS